MHGSFNISLRYLKNYNTRKMKIPNRLMPLGYIVLEWIIADVTSVLRQAAQYTSWKHEDFVAITEELYFTF